MGHWYYTAGGQQVGPVSVDQLRSLAHSRQIQPDTLVWTEGMPQWSPLQTIAGLAQTTAVTPQGSSSAVALTYAVPGATSKDEITVTPRAIEHLRKTQPWVRFLSILFLIAAGLIFSIALIAISTNRGGDVAARMPYFLGICVAAAVYGCIALLLSNYAMAITKLKKERTSINLERALRCQQVFWTVTGVLMALALVAYLGIALAHAMNARL